jgi:uroporphyrin-3 C-methyltransferase
MSEPKITTPALPNKRQYFLPYMLTFLALLMASYSLWQGWHIQHEQDRVLKAMQEHSTIDSALTKIQSDSLTLSSDLKRFEQKTIDLNATHQSVREEMLGLVERLKLIEDAVARIADRRISGSAALHLNEAEFLLQLGQERLQLFDDFDATRRAFLLADAELAAIDDPVFTNIRQTLASEIEALRTANQTDRHALIATLDQISDQVGLLKTHADFEQEANISKSKDDSGFFDRGLAILSSYVRVHRDDAQDSVRIYPLQAKATQALITVELALAKTALILGRKTLFELHIQRSQALIRNAFLPDDQATKASLEGLSKMAGLASHLNHPDVSRSLFELRNLRAMRNVINEPTSDPNNIGTATP